jgi:hypothetical protein
MSDMIAIPNSTDGSRSAVVPVPRCAISTRLATVKDIPFIDELQKLHQHMLGWTPRATFEGKIKAGHVLIAEQSGGEDGGTKKENSAGKPGSAPLPASILHSQSSARVSAVGYCISQDRYMGHDDVGIVYQLNVAPIKQRHLIGATLIKTVFDRAAYGCRLFCCWCAQDIAANYFWESIGFVPLAFRAGNRKKQRIHIFWERRVRLDDTTTPYWFPFETRGGMMNEARLVLPIPPGTHWRDAKPILLPQSEPEKPNALSAPRSKEKAREPSVAYKMAVIRSKSKHLKGVPAGKAAIITSGGFRYVDRADYVPEPAPPKPKRKPSAPKQKNDPRHVAMVRELRDRYMEQINSGAMQLEFNGKYDVSRALSDAGELRLIAQSQDRSAA